MKLNFVIATAAAVLAMAGAGSASAASYSLVGTTPTLVGGDDAYVNFSDEAANANFSYTYYFNLGATGNPDTAYTTINATTNSVTKANPLGTPSVTNLVASFEDLTTGKPVISLVGGNGDLTLAANSKYSVTISGTIAIKGGSGQFDITTVPAVPGPEGFAVAIAGMGALFLVRRRAARRLAA